MPKPNPPFRILINQPIWIPAEKALPFLAAIQRNPTWWLDAGIEFKYLNIRMDARTGDMRIKAGPPLSSSDSKYLDPM